MEHISRLRDGEISFHLSLIVFCSRINLRLQLDTPSLHYHPEEWHIGGDEVATFPAFHAQQKVNQNVFGNDILLQVG